MTGGQRLLEGVGEGVDGTVPLGYLETIEVRTVVGDDTVEDAHLHGRPGEAARHGEGGGG